MVILVRVFHINTTLSDSHITFMKIFDFKYLVMISNHINLFDEYLWWFDGEVLTCRNQSKVTHQLLQNRMKVHNMSMYSRIPIPSVFTTPFNPLSQKELIVEQMAPLSRFELSGLEMLEADPEVLALFEKINWKLFFWGFSGHNEEVTR